jgi:DNA-binding transcriptional LysR family regulator
MVRKINWDRQFGRRLKLRDLHVFFTVVQAGSMAKAAEQLGVAQPTVSETIADLEKSYGVRLLDRSPRGVESTIYGAALHRRCVAAFDELKQSGRDIENLSDPKVGDLWIGCQESLLAAILPPIIRRFSKDYPQVTLHVDDVPSPAVQLAELRNRKYDFVLARIVRPLTKEEDVHVETLFHDHLVIAADARNKLARRRKIDLAELADEPWILQPADSWAYLRLAEAFEQRGLKMPKASLMTLSVPLRNHLLADSNHITASANSVLRLHAARYGLKALSVDLPRRPWPAVIITPRNRTLNPLVERFVECARMVVKAMEGMAGRPHVSKLSAAPDTLQA